MVNRLIGTKAEVIKLRLQGASYSQIKSQLGVSKSTLSGWLKKYPLSPKRIRELRDFSEKRIESFRNTMRKKKEIRQQSVYQKEKEYLYPLSNKELYPAGLLLYWGEGAKTTPAASSLSNTNPSIVKFFVYWLLYILHIPKNKIHIKLHLYSDMDGESETDFWSRELKIPKEQFKKPYLKTSTLSGLTYKSFGHGTCNIMVYSRDLTEKIIQGIKVISDGYTNLT